MAARATLLAAALLALTGCTKALQSDACSGDDVLCGTACTDLNSSTENCGDCGNACNVDAGSICDAGSCWLGCPSGATACPPENPTTCADLGSDDGNCGACGRVCGQGLRCTRGICFCPPSDVCQ